VKLDVKTLMHWQSTPYTLPLLLTSLIAASLTGFAGRKRIAPGAIPFIWLMFALTLWSLGYALELTSANLAAKLLWTKVEYIGILIVPTAFLSFTLQHTHREKRLTRRNVRVLALIPLITFLVVWTNDYHRLFHHHTVLETSGPFSMLDITYGPFFWLHTAYSYTLLAGGTFLLLKEWRGAPEPYARQSGILLVGVSVPWLSNALYIVGNPLPNLDLTPFAFTLSGLAIAWGIFRLRLLDIIPLAREAVIEGMSDGIIVLDDRGQVVDLNPAAEKIIGHPATQIVGGPALHIFSQAGLSSWVPLIQGNSHHSAPETSTTLTLGQEREQRTFELRVKPLHKRGSETQPTPHNDAATGKLLILRDVTQLLKAGQALQQRTAELEARNTELDDFAHTVAHDLKNPLSVINHLLTKAI